MISNWVENELEGIDIGDQRLNKRLAHLLTSASKQPSVSINKMFHTRKEVQACYRFFSNDLVDEKKIIEPHRIRTIERANIHPVVLCLSDTTSLNYTTRKTLQDSGYISSNNAQGFFLHATIAITPDRLHLGIIGQKIWSRAKEKKVRTSRDRERLLFAEKESYRWLEAYIESCGLAESCEDSQVVHITDREGDIFEIYDEYQNRKAVKKNSAHFIVRSNHNRTIYSEEESTNCLYDKLAASEKLAEISFEVIKREDNTKRRVCQSIHALPIQIKSRYGADRPNLICSLNAVYLREHNPPEGEKPIIWCLLTSLAINDIGSLKQIIEYYLCRWEIEVFFKTYKSGCKIEEKSLRSADRLFPLFCFFLLVAWRVNYLLHIGRVLPELSCEAFFERSEWKAGYIAATRIKIPPTDPPTMQIMMSYVAKLGGHLGRKSDPIPGVKAIWIGICKLTNYADAWDLFGPEAREKSEFIVKKSYA